MNSVKFLQDTGPYSHKEGTPHVSVQKKKVTIDQHLRSLNLVNKNMGLPVKF